jgi:hypothetical protein
VPEERCAILLEEDVPVDPRKYGDLVAPLLGLTKVEARMAVRKGRGLFLENLRDEDARRLADELAKDGIRAHVVPCDRMPVLPPPRKVVHLERGEELLSYRGDGGATALPWEAIGVASCGVTARPEVGDWFGQVRFADVPPLHRLEGRDREVVRENLILKMSSGAGTGRTPGRPNPDSLFEEIDRRYSDKVRVAFDLVTRDLGTWLRVPLEEMGYVYASGGVKMGGAWGFQLLAADLREKCAPALTEITLKLLGGTDIRELVFPQAEEFARHTAWIAIKRYLWPDAASSSLSPGPPEPPTGGGSSSASSGPGMPSTSS